MYAFRLPAIAAVLLLAASLSGLSPGHAQYRYDGGPFSPGWSAAPATRVVARNSRSAVTTPRRLVRAPAGAAAIPLPIPRPAIPAVAEPAPITEGTVALSTSLPRAHLSPRVGSAEWQAEQTALAQEDARIRQIINSICRGC